MTKKKVEIKNKTASTAEQGKESKAKKPKAEKTDEIEQPSLEDELKEAKEKYAELNDKFLRLFSEFDNYRKRTIKEKAELIATASSGVIEGLLPVLDDLDRALLSFREHKADQEMVQGVELIQGKLFNYLKQKGLEPMDAMGKDFDTDFHDALTQTPSPDEGMKGKVVDVIEKGYLLNGRIIRHAKVVVGV